MKKFFKFVCSAALFCGAIAGGIYAYQKFFAPDPFDDDLEDVLEEDTPEESKVSERGYVSLTPEDTEEADEAKTEENPSKEETTEA